MTRTHTPLTVIGQQFREKTKTTPAGTFFWLVANESAEKVVVLVHGVTGNKLDMVALGEEYIKQGYAVFAPDLPGHGSAPALNADTFDDLGNWLRDFIFAIGRTPDILAGNSFASAICYNFATQGYLSPSTHLILACPTPDIAWSSRALRRASGVLPSKLAIKSYNSRLAIKARVAYLSKSKRSSAKQWLNESEYLKIPFIDAAVSNRMSMLLESHNPYLVSLPEKVQRQITVIVGEKDNVITKQSLPTLRKILPHARLLLVPHVGHILHFEAPEVIANGLVSSN
ncbi:MAG TPA: alpha/beta hydrolase [Candidatus Saccharimonadales bacterium]|nr:alpha/beta hydrolase [Candidatus Saccharimonadales bacterium]